MSVLVVAEKPSVARDIASVLGCRENCGGFLSGNGYVVSWAIGHLVGLCDPEEYDAAYKKWTRDSLPIIPPEIRLKVIHGTKTQFNILKKLMQSREVSEIVCATDAGREGELIFRYIYEAAGCKKPFKRLWISSLTVPAIKKGFEELKDGHEYDNLYYSARCRSEADWLVGINASRAYTLGYDALLSIGRVQTPALSFIVARKKEIDSFKPQTYWEVHASFGRNPGYKGIWFNPKDSDSKIASCEEAERIAAIVRGKPGEVSEIKTENVRKPPPLLFDLTELQRECNRKFGLTAKKTLEVAQTLYERHKAITYPRTDSRYLSKDMYAGVKKVLESFDGELGRLAEMPLALSALPFTKRVFDNGKVTDHHAIIPTGKKAKLPELEQKVFDLIARRLIAAFYADYIYETTRVVTVSEGENFLSKGITVLEAGWTSVLGAENAHFSDDNPAALPPLTKGDVNLISSVKTTEKQTQPPKPYTDATLLSAMEHCGRFVEDEELKEQLKESGLGTPATRAQIIERLIEVGYIKRAGKTLTATEKGVKLIEVVPFELKSPETTAKWERALSRISKGDLDAHKFDESIRRYVYYIIEESRKVNSMVIFDKEERRKAARSSKSAKNTYGRKKAYGKVQKSN